MGYVLASLDNTPVQRSSQPGDYALAIALVSQGKIDLKPLVTHRSAIRS